MDKYINAAKALITSPYILKGTEKFAFGIPYQLFKSFHKADYKIWEEYKDKYAGERCFIIGTGPSLDLGILHKLDNEYTFGVNSLVNVFDESNWLPSFYCITDPKVYKRLESDLKKYPTLKAFYPSNRINSSFLSGPTFALNCSDMYKVKALDYFRFTEFGTDLTREIFDGGTVVYVAMQIAAYMGFREIYLLGVDVNYGYQENNHNAKLEYNNRGHHYTDTRSTGDIMIEAFKIAKEYAESHNIKIYNVNKKGRLDLFQRISLEEIGL